MSQRVKTVLITLPEPVDGRSPYYDLAEKYKVGLLFREFTTIQPITPRDFRKEKVDILAHTAIVLTSRIAIEHFFRLCTEMRIDLPPTMKFFCVSETVALYLQKFITYRKRKVFYPKLKEQEIFDLMLKQKGETYLVPRANTGTNDVVEFLKKHNIKHNEASFYAIESNDLSDLEKTRFDLIALYSPGAVKAIYDNFPDFKQEDRKIAAFGANTAQAVLDAGLTLDIEAPTPRAPSMTMALEEYLRTVNK
ncbi:MAG: uroporphyrinogen-III synthase [Bacteroidota bacterium]|nr:uroporphyrinogen-III synthase [Bacteroidota bacterium]